MTGDDMIPLCTDGLQVTTDAGALTPPPVAAPGAGKEERFFAGEPVHGDPFLQPITFDPESVHRSGGLAEIGDSELVADFQLAVGAWSGTEDTEALRATFKRTRESLLARFADLRQQLAEAQRAAAEARTVTEAMVEAGAKALWLQWWTISGTWPSRRLARNYLDASRRVLTAALSPLGRDGGSGA